MKGKRGNMDEEKIQKVINVQGQPIKMEISRGSGGRYDYSVSLYGEDPEKMIFALKSLTDRLDLEYPYKEVKK